MPSRPSLADVLNPSQPVMGLDFDQLLRPRTPTVGVTPEIRARMKSVANIKKLISEKGSTPQRQMLLKQVQDSMEAMAQKQFDRIDNPPPSTPRLLQRPSDWRQNQAEANRAQRQTGKEKGLADYMVNRRRRATMSPRGLQRMQAEDARRLKRQAAAAPPPGFNLPRTPPMPLGPPPPATLQSIQDRLDAQRYSP